MIYFWIENTMFKCALFPIQLSTILEGLCMFFICNIVCYLNYASPADYLIYLYVINTISNQ